MRPITPAEYQRRVREAQRKQKQAVDNYNLQVRQHNQKVTQSINNYNRQVNAHNARVRADQQRLKNEIARLARQPVRSQLVTYRVSAERVTTAYRQLEERAESQYDGRYNELLDLSERETANNIGVLNVLLDESNQVFDQQSNSEHADLSVELASISPDLDARWKGAVFALSPNNPDAARHFCTSAREIISTILEVKAPDAEVFALAPHCETTEQGKPTRRSKIKYFLSRNGMVDDAVEDFVEQDMQNVVELFRYFNDGTHGSAGNFNLTQLGVIRKRVEDAIHFLHKIIDVEN
jgi:hypothetical protein